MNTSSKTMLRFAFCLLIAHSVAAADPYESYVRTSEDFRAVKQEKAWAPKAWPSWRFMPWKHQWTIGYDDAAGRWSVERGYNGAFVDRDGIGTQDSATGRLDWIEKFGLRFYVDHAAGKGLLHLWDGDKVKPHLDELNTTGVRPAPLNAATRAQLEARSIWQTWYYPAHGNRGHIGWVEKWFDGKTPKPWRIAGAEERMHRHSPAVFLPCVPARR